MRRKDLVNSIPAYGLAIVLVWIGLMKYTTYEAQVIEGLIANSPIMSWMYQLLDVSTVSSLIGTSELVIAMLLFTRPWKPQIAKFGGLGAIGMFSTTLTFLVSTPGAWEASLGGFPAPSVDVGQFILKDIALLSIALWIVLQEEIKN